MVASSRMPRKRPEDVREYQVLVRLTKEESERLDAMAKRDQRPRANLGYVLLIAAMDAAEDGSGVLPEHLRRIPPPDTGPSVSAAPKTATGERTRSRA